MLYHIEFDFVEIDANQKVDRKELGLDKTAKI